MQDTAQLVKQYFIASDFDKTLSFNDSGNVLSELVGISTREFEKRLPYLPSSISFSKARS